MEHTIDRRAFLWKSLLTTTSGLLANPLLKAAVASNGAASWPEDFTLHKIANVLSVDTFLDTSDTVRNAEKRIYAGYTIAKNRLVQRAELSIEKQKGAKSTVFHISYWRNGTPAGAASSPDQIVYKYRINGRVFGVQDAFFAARKWSFYGDIYDLTEDRTIPLTQHEYTGSLKNKHIVMSGLDKPKKIQKPDSLPVHFKWLLGPLIENMHTMGMQQPYRLAMIDEADILHPSLSVQLLKHIDLVQESKKHRFYAYLTVGPGVIPTVHWTNDAGDTVLFITGLEGYFLTND